MNEGNPEDRFAELDNMPEVNMGEITSDFEARPEAIYDAVVEDIELKHTDNDPTRPYLSWTFELPKTESYKKSKAWLNTSLQSQALWRVKKVFEAFGVDVSGSLNIGAAVRSCLGKECKLWLTVKVFEGKEKNEVAEVLSAAGVSAPAF